MSRDQERRTSFISSSSTPDADRLARSLPAGPRAACPTRAVADGWTWDWTDDLGAWRDELEALPLADQVVVCTWHDELPPASIVELEPAQWRDRVEWPTALWFVTLVAAVTRCRDGGSVVAVVDRPATLDAVERGAIVVVAEGIINVTRSLAASEGPRGVRVNAVMTSRGTANHGLVGAPPPLASFPGRVDVEVAGAVRMLLADDAIGVTGTSISATSGRR